MIKKNKVNDTLTQSAYQLELNCETDCDRHSGGMTLPQNLVSYLSPIHLSHYSPQPQPADISAVMLRTSSPDDP